MNLMIPDGSPIEGRQIDIGFKFTFRLITTLIYVLMDIFFPIFITFSYDIQFQTNFVKFKSLLFIYDVNEIGNNLFNKREQLRSKTFLKLLV
jgi:hypothetical protein